ncbi:MAG: hypothetical protein FWG67_06340 [Defluviitaleaceae bacterium]|nr:hypothetical protein [Defluviitaleaceae bacterium]
MLKRAFEAAVTNQHIDEMLQTYNLNNQRVAIIAPTFDESHRLIESDDPQLYYTQRDDLSILLHRLNGMQENGRIHLLHDGDDATNTNEIFDYVIFSHEFMEFEKNQVLNALRQNNPDLRYIELS